MLEIKGDCYLWVHDDGARTHNRAGPRIVRFAILSGFRRIPPCLLRFNLPFLPTPSLLFARCRWLPPSPPPPPPPPPSSSSSSLLFLFLLRVRRELASLLQGNRWVARGQTFIRLRGRQERRPVDAKKVEYLARRRPRGTTLHEVCHTYRLFRLVDAAGGKERQREKARERERERERKSERREGGTCADDGQGVGYTRTE